MASQSTSRAPEYRPIASKQHFLIMLLIQVALVCFGFYQQHGNTNGTSVLPENRNVIPLYASVIVLEWALMLAVLRGIRSNGITLWDLVGDRWKTWKDIALDVAIGIPFVLLWEATAWLTHRMLGPDSAKSISTLLPRTALEIGLWILVSVSAGICEEIVFRGYFQSQFAAYTRSMAAAVVLQGIVFGVGHAYQGFKQVLIISVLGILYGALAAWRRNLRVNMISHAWSDIWSGWLSAAFR